ncbi:hypothetical protein MD535_08170 [Vibrio sp. ZSDZ65]|uniref:Uncharacterized protein n=1 Tax=Vibrio qingdaonensis TaxID=2829491 RepID=A0A9X3HWN9_9VIBR|nr:hypothetical protein [Vibrio qingdaonensis]MCW8345982.1 hypothetical protein [Vibrio qingdaonensis]
MKQSIAAFQNEPTSGTTADHQHQTKSARQQTQKSRTLYRVRLSHFQGQQAKVAKGCNQHSLALSGM